MKETPKKSKEKKKNRAPFLGAVALAITGATGIIQVVRKGVDVLTQATSTESLQKGSPQIKNALNAVPAESKGHRDEKKLALTLKDEDDPKLLLKSEAQKAIAGNKDAAEWVGRLINIMAKDGRSNQEIEEEFALGHKEKEVLQSAYLFNTKMPQNQLQALALMSEAGDPYNSLFLTLTMKTVTEINATAETAVDIVARNMFNPNSAYGIPTAHLDVCLQIVEHAYLGRPGKSRIQEILDRTQNQ